jgi:hypothetical protein
VDRDVEVELAEPCGDGGRECVSVGLKLGAAELVEFLPQRRKVIERVFLRLLARG